MRVRSTYSTSTLPASPSAGSQVGSYGGTPGPVGSRFFADDGILSAGSLAHRDLHADPGDAEDQLFCAVQVLSGLRGIETLEAGLETVWIPREGYAPRQRIHGHRYDRRTTYRLGLREMTVRPTSGGIEFVPIIPRYRVDGWHSIEHIDENSFRTSAGDVLRRLV